MTSREVTAVEVTASKYQRTHNPVRRVEVKCFESERDQHGQCTACGNYVRSRRPHRPNVTGSLGWIQHYADGSTLYIVPEGSV